MIDSTEPKLVAGNSNKPLAKSIAKRMSMHRGKPIDLVKARVERFNDQERGQVFWETVMRLLKKIKENNSQTCIQ